MQTYLCILESDSMKLRHGLLTAMHIPSTYPIKMNLRPRTTLRTLRRDLLVVFPGIKLASS